MSIRRSFLWIPDLLRRLERTIDAALLFLIQPDNAFYSPRSGRRQDEVTTCFSQYLGLPPANPLYSSSGIRRHCFASRRTFDTQFSEPPLRSSFFLCTRDGGGNILSWSSRFR